jgi:hypothetical protein
VPRASASAAIDPDRPEMLGENDILSASGLTDIVSRRPRRCWLAGCRRRQPGAARHRT